MPYGKALVDTVESSGNLAITGNTSITGNVTTTGTLTSSTGTTYPLVSDTAKNSTSGTTVDFTGIPSWAKRITLMLSGVSTSGTSNWLVQLGTASGIEATGYTSVGAYIGATPSGNNYTTGFGLFITSTNHVMQGTITLTQLSSTANTWTCFGGLAGSGQGAGYIYNTSGSKSLSAPLDRVRLTTVNGTDTFDAGSINILYE
jgi:hypothetical protein